MPEQGVKFLCKRAIENGQRQLTPVEKELLKKGIDDAVKNKVCNDCTLFQRKVRYERKRVDYEPSCGGHCRCAG